MTQIKPYLILRRLLITSGGASVYDEQFKTGVNVIRGDNSSGKSTIADFIFHALGGDLTKWKQHALRCEYTYAEVNLSGNLFVLKRPVSSRAGMEIFSGTMDEAMKSQASGWLKYPYQATENKESFYQALFKEMGIPYSTSSANESITMHQLLRLMYVDQMTSLDRLFKFDKFDSPNKRKAIGELIIGLSGKDLFEFRVRAQKLNAILDARIKEINTLHAFLGKDLRNRNTIDNEIDNLNKKIGELENQLNQVELEGHDEDYELVNSIKNGIYNKQSQLEAATNDKYSFTYEINDSLGFVESLISRIEALKNSSKVINALSDVSFSYCPSCYSEIKTAQEGQCQLCKAETAGLDESEKDPTFKIRKEIEFQIAETNHLIKIRQAKISETDIIIEELTNQIEMLKSKYKSIVRPSVQIKNKQTELIFEIGAINGEIKKISEEKNRITKLEDKYKEREATQAELNKINDYIKIMESKSEQEYTAKKDKLSYLTKNIISKDINHEEEFKDAKKVEFDFGEDKVSVDDRVLFSASSMVYLKNAFRLALFQASCLDRSYIYPRFLLMDNVEDKGMVPERSQKFQESIFEVSESLDAVHQIIFTTSMIAPQIEGTEFCVGEYYDDNNKSLRFRK